MKRPRKLLISAVLTGVLAVCLLVGLLRIAYLYDNKYTAGPPYGEGGVLAFAEDDVRRPLPLIDGWLVSVNGAGPQETFIGEYSNFSYLSRSASPFGSAVYQLTLRCPGERTLLLELPEIFTDYTLSIDDVSVAARGSGSTVEFLLQDEATLVLEVENHTHYHSGLYFPPVLGTSAAIAGLQTDRITFYTVLCAVSLTLVLSSAALWLSRERDGLFLHFAALCLCFFFSCLHPFVWRAGWNGTPWYALEDTARLLLLAEAVEIGFRLAGWDSRRLYRRFVRPAFLAACLATFFMVTAIIPNWGNLINAYSILTEIVTVAGWLCLCVCTVGAVSGGKPGGICLTGGCCALGVGYLVNLLNTNRFEPLRFGWQTEYAGGCMVLFFAGLIFCYNRAILLQNRRLMGHMEELIQERTKELETVLQERKNFFSDMAHNLKAPIMAVHGFIHLIQEGNLYLDDELKTYIRLIEEENEDIGKRVQSLSTLNAFDRITAPKEPLDVDELLSQVEKNNAPEVDVAGIHFQVGRLDQRVTILAQREKLLILFENLIYNAISFTPPEGSITVTPRLEDGAVVIEVADTGCGIAPEHLPHIFERFYSVREQASEGSGLGLYICKLTVEELGGSISTCSEPGKGTTFTVQLPVLTAKPPLYRGE